MSSLASNVDCPLPKCDICHKPFTTTRVRDRHRATMHIVPPLYECIEDGCNARFAFPKELQTHITIEHHMNLTCCGTTFKDTWAWNVHQFQCHKSYSERLAHAKTQPVGENYLMKLYLLIHESGSYCKIGRTKNPISLRLANLVTHNNEKMELCKCWDLSEKFEEVVVVHALEKESHYHMLELGFQQKEFTEEYFCFRNRELEERLIQYFLETLVEQHEAKENVVLLSPVIMEQVERPPKRKYTRIENPTEQQRKLRQASRQWQQDRKGQWLYFAGAENNIVKIGHTSHNPTSRLSNHNSQWSHYGKFNLICEFPLGEEYKCTTKRSVFEKKAIYALRQRFSLVGVSQEHFKCSESERAEFIAIINKVIAEGI